MLKRMELYGHVTHTSSCSWFRDSH